MKLGQPANLPAMQRPQLEHIIRAAAGITGAQEFIIIGSQAVLGQFPDAPAELLVSIAAPELPGALETLARTVRFLKTVQLPFLAMFLRCDFPFLSWKHFDG